MRPKQYKRASYPWMGNRYFRLFRLNRRAMFAIPLEHINMIHFDVKAGEMRIKVL